MNTADHHGQLRRELGVPGAVMMGLGSVVGTGIFVSIGIAAGATGPSVILAILLAAAVATCNGLSSAQLAASHAVSGGTYEYGYRYLSPALGFTAGWVFLLSKTASAATAALGFAGYLLQLTGRDADKTWIAAGAVLAFTLLALAGVRRSNAANIAVVSVTLGALLAFILVGLPELGRDGAANLSPFFQPAHGRSDIEAFFYATALMFVAYTGYARIATMGEEVRDPRTSIPKAIIITLVISALVYGLVALVALAAIGPQQLALTTRGESTPLEAAARTFATPEVAYFVSIGAITAMLGVLLNLILGLSRVVLAMGRKGDLPPLLATVSADGQAPSAAVVAVGLAIGALTLIGNVETTWAFSAFTVLVYYAITNLAALKLPASERRYPAWIAAIGLASCLFLAFWVPVPIWLAGLAIIAAGLAWHGLAGRLWRRKSRAKR